eukprot:566924-Rhodomonas_salina.1
MALTSSDDGVVRMLVGGEIKASGSVSPVPHPLQGEWGAALGRSHSGSQAIPKQYAAGRLRRARWWGIELTTECIDAAQEGCGQMQGLEGLLHCVDFDGTDDEGSVEAVTGDQHLAWCETNRDGGTMVTFLCTDCSTTPSDEVSWGFCNTQPAVALPLSRFDYDREELTRQLAVSDTSLDGCAFTSLIFESNSARAKSVASERGNGLMEKREFNPSQGKAI